MRASISWFEVEVTDSVGHTFLATHRPTSVQILIHMHRDRLVTLSLPLLPLNLSFAQLYVSGYTLIFYSPRIGPSHHHIIWHHYTDTSFSVFTPHISIPFKCLILASVIYKHLVLAPHITTYWPLIKHLIIWVITTGSEFVLRFF